MTSRGLTMLMATWVLVAAGACSKGKSSSGAGGGSSAGSSESSSSSAGGRSGSDGGAGIILDAGAGLVDAASPLHDAGRDGPTSADGSPVGGADARGSTGGKGGSTSGSGGSSKVDAGPGPCQVVITAENSEKSLTGLVPGDNRTLTVRGTIVWGTATRTTPTWQWTVRGPDRNTLTTMVDPSAEIDTAKIQFPLLSSGNYDISVSATTSCHGSATAIAGQEWPQMFFVRVLPPATSGSSSGQTCVNNATRWCPSEDAVPYEAVYPLSDMTNVEMMIGLTKGTSVVIDPAFGPDPEAFPPKAIPSTIHIAPNLSQHSRYSSWTIDGASDEKPFQAILNGAPLQYDVLVVPAGTGDPITFPPFRIGPLLARDFPWTSFNVTPGVTVRGTVRVSGSPLMGARVLLRADTADQVTLPLPSTWGTSQVTGSYSLQARNDSYSTFSVIVIPPVGTTLPLVTVPNCIDLRRANDGDTLADVDFSWAALATTNLNVTVMMPDGQSPASSVRVRLLSQDEENKIPEPGVLTINGVGAGPASGSLRLDATTNESGVVTFGAIPKAGYHLVLVPPDELADAAITTADLDLTGVSNEEPRIFQLTRKAKLTGNISPKASSAGGRLLAIDTGTDILGNTLSSSIDSEGNYTLMADPGRTYRLSVEPAPRKNLPSRIPLYGVTATSQSMRQVDRWLPTGLKVSGSVKFGGKNVSGAIVQVYCQQSGMDGCMDPKNPTPDLPLPVVETATQADGSYIYYLPDPNSSP